MPELIKIHNQFQFQLRVPDGNEVTTRANPAATAAAAASAPAPRGS